MPRHKGQKRGRRPYPLKGIWGKKKMRVPSGQKGYVRTGGLYGRFGGPGAEMKFRDRLVLSTSVAPTGTMLDRSHNVIPQGNGAEERVGRKVTIRFLQVRGNIEMDSTSSLAATDAQVRIVFAIDKQTNGLEALLPDVISFGGVTDIFAFRNLANLSRFSIIYDKTFNLPVLATWPNFIATDTHSVPVKRKFAFTKKLNLPIEFDETFDTGVISTQRTNNIFSFAMSEAPGAPLPKVTYQFRIRYTDA